MKRFNPNELDTKWQKIWHDERRYEASTDTNKQKMYVSGMFPYPSGSGLHSGHAFSYTIVDTLARFYRAHDYNVLNPMGWDTFGLPAENYAIKTGTAPAVVTAENISNFKKQFQRMGVSIDWSREISTSDPEYYKWTQWVFTEFFKRGLAYQKDASQWWCTIDQTVLANEQVINGKSWRHDGPDDPLVIKKNITQWFFKITDYADALLQEIPSLDWPDKIKTAQTNWIGKSEGAEIQFRLEDDSDTIIVFSTRPDTLFGASFIVLAPEHPLATTVAAANAVEAVQQYIDEAIKKSEIDRASEGKEKTGVFTGSYAINPASGEKVPIWIADYVLGGYGTGAVMGVPAHDERDFAFAETYSLPIVEVIEKPESVTEQCYHGEGILKNSHQFDGMTTAQAREELVAWLEQQDLGTAKVTYKMRDWLISRQRYWGAPIPIVHVKDHGPVALPASELPLLLPDVEDYQPKGDGKSVLASIEDWVHIWYNMDTGKSVPFSSEKPQDGDWREAHRETDTMDGYACSSWYLLRYTDPHNTEQAWSKEAANYWSPVDYYVGGDHAVAHLLYVRFWSHVFNDMKLLDVKEPVKKLVYHGYVNAEDGRKMSKSLGNVIDPLDIIDQGYGADTLRTYVLFMGPIELDSAWSSQGVGGVYRFLNRAWTLTQEYLDADKTDEQLPAELESLRHRTIKKVTNDYHNLGFNTAIASLMEYVNDLYKYKTNGFTNDWQMHLETLVQLLAPFAPHMTAELWEQLGHTEPLDTAMWPTWDEVLTKTATITLAVQVNGKLRATIELSADVSEEDATKAALAHEHVQKFTQDKLPKKIIFIPGRLLNIVI